MDRFVIDNHEPKGFRSNRADRIGFLKCFAKISVYPCIRVSMIYLNIVIVCVIFENILHLLVQGKNPTGLS